MLRQLNTLHQGLKAVHNDRVVEERFCQKWAMKEYILERKKVDSLRMKYPVDKIN